MAFDANGWTNQSKYANNIPKHNGKAPPENGQMLFQAKGTTNKKKWTFPRITSHRTIPPYPTLPCPLPLSLFSPKTKNK